MSEMNDEIKKFRYKINKIICIDIITLKVYTQENSDLKKKKMCCNLPN